MQPPEASEKHVQFAVSLKPDRDGFFRRSCPSCGRDFKTEIDVADLQWELASQCQRMGVEIGAQEAHDPTSMQCPYCGHADQPSEMHTDETVSYLKRIVHREYVLPQLNKLFSGLEDSFGGNRSGGFISISWDFKHTRATLPPRPFHGPEPADYKIIEFLCCGKKAKIAEAWNDVSICPYCAAAVRLT